MVELMCFDRCWVSTDDVFNEVEECRKLKGNDTQMLKSEYERSLDLMISTAVTCSAYLDIDVYQGD